MKFNQNWLLDWVDPGIPIGELTDRLTMAGLEVDATEPVAAPLDGVVVAAVLTAEKHPQADRLSCCLVDAGMGEPVAVVCGAANVRAGLKTAFAPPGVALPGGRRIEKTEIRGVSSEGMLCSSSELSLGEDDAGILELPDDAPVGCLLDDYLKLDDTIVDIDLTPNRGDCLCVIGIAREVGVLTEKTVRPIDIPAVANEIGDTFAVELQAPDACPRYVGRVIRDIDVNAPTPIWMKERLRRCGLRSIGAVVDVTNYVMLELGQPMHAFDLDALDGGIAVRYARDNETLTLLDGQTVTLSKDTLVIADRTQAVAMAGVMGGEGSAVQADTRHVFLESAFFDPVNLIGTARRFKLHTDASHRFERGVDFKGQERAIERATQWLLEICGGRPGPVQAVESPEDLPKNTRIEFRPAQVKRVLGIDVSEEQIVQIFERLGLVVEVKPEHLCVHPPSFRFDLALEADLMEEVARIYGYDRIEPQVPHARVSMDGVGEGGNRVERARRVMVARGFFEAITYSFIDPRHFSQISPEIEPHALANPIASDMAVMRASLWPGLLQAAKYNVNRRHREVRLFEAGMVFERTPEGVRQHNRIGAIALGDAVPEQWGTTSRPVDFFDLKQDLDALLTVLGGSQYTVTAAQHPALHPGYNADISIDGISIGYIGSLHPGVTQDWDFEVGPVLFEIEIDKVPFGRTPRFRPLSKFPWVRRDINIVVSGSVTAAEVLESVRRGAGGLLRDLQLFDVYRGQGIDSDKKSLTMSLIFQADSSTLIEHVIEQAVDSVLEQLKRDVGGTIRG